MSLENLLPSARPKFTKFAYEVIKPGQLWRLREMDAPSILAQIETIGLIDADSAGIVSGGEVQA